MNIVNAFTDVKDVGIGSKPTQVITSLNDLQELQIGRGYLAFKADQSGIWLGGNKFIDAPFSVDMSGHMKATDLTLTGYVSKDGSNQNFTGSLQLLDGLGNIAIFIGDDADL